MQWNSRLNEEGCGWNPESIGLSFWPGLVLEPHSFKSPDWAGWMTQMVGLLVVGRSSTGSTSTSASRLPAADKDAVAQRRLKAAWPTSWGSGSCRSQRCGSSPAGVLAAQGVPLVLGGKAMARVVEVATMPEKMGLLKPAKRWAECCCALL